MGFRLWGLEFRVMGLGDRLRSLAVFRLPVESLRFTAPAESQGFTGFSVFSFRAGGGRV